MSAVIKMMRTPLSDDCLRKILGNNIKIVLHPDLSTHNNIRELLNNPKDFCLSYTKRSIYVVIGLA